MAGLTAFYMFYIYFITFGGNCRANSFKEFFPILGVTTSKELDREDKRPIPLFANSRINMERDEAISSRGRYTPHPKESDNIMLFPLLVLAVRTLFSRFIGVPTLQGQLNPDPLSNWLYPLINGPYELISKENWFKFLSNAMTSIGISSSRLLIAYFLYGPIPFHSQNLWDNFKPFLHFIYN
jgi:NADH:ubiquinone oxidoreductase subunit 5 (subunit L)/multisubunit Na+/H+ antiporter MnhA subunit